MIPSAAQQITHAHTVRPASNWRMRSYKSPVTAPAAVARVGQSSQPSSTHLLKFPFLRFATLSFAIPPPISASVRSRQAGTETEREASAMEALGPGKEFQETRTPAGRASRVWDACAQRRRFTWGRGCSEALTHWRGKQTRGPARVSVRNVYVALITGGGSHGLCSNEASECVFLSGSQCARAALFIRGTHGSPCRRSHCVSGDLTRSFLLPSFRVVLCLRCRP